MVHMKFFCNAKFALLISTERIRAKKSVYTIHEIRQISHIRILAHPYFSQKFWGKNRRATKKIYRKF